jgi:TorA maturation chaperone TorD
VVEAAMVEGVATEDAVEESLSAEEITELSELMDQRAAVYAFMARLFRVEVDEALLQELKAMRFPAATGSEPVDEGYKFLSKFVGGIYENTLTDLAVDYVNVFIGHGINAFSAAYPYESVYTSPRRLMMQEARDEVLALYRSEGLDKLSSYKEAEDHLALELEFIQILSSRTAEALREGDEDRALALVLTQKNFMYDHLLNWVPLMTKDMKKFAKTDLYKGLAYLTEGYLKADYQLLKDLTAEEVSK